jgi:glycine/D-amino acid oxidase-like deaminating enzyme
MPSAAKPITGIFVNDDFARGHQLRDRARFSSPKRQQKVPIVIVGGGVAGLCAAWRLQKRGVHDFILLEMESHAGGNSRSGQNEVSAYPWGAHYVPVPSRKNTLVREIFEDFGLVRDGVWDERNLCFSPQERLFINGQWQEEIEPAYDKDQFQRFGARMRELRATGEFTIPIAEAAHTKTAAMDRMSMSDWMRQEKFTSPYLNWYVNYACRDDYGSLAADTSAWAGAHYFCSRDPEEKGPLTWPEGNGWLVKQLLARVPVHTGELVHRIVREGPGWKVTSGETEYLAEAVIFAAPTFLAPYVIDPAPPLIHRVYSPWLTANLTMERPPKEDDSELAWDNVIYDSPALGYVVATHQSLATRVDRSVWTYYWSFAEMAPQTARKLLLEKDWNFWKEAILNDLSKAHPDIRDCVSRLDIMRFGHAMARPIPGFLSQKQTAPERLYFANSDLSGYSIFEEAQYHGVRAADDALTALGLRSNPTHR